MKSIDLAPQQKTQIENQLLAWFSNNARPLPWRKNYAPYHIWLSEVMLQQTQMDRVVQYFTRWMEKLPSLEAVAKADEEELLKLWEGLGYYSRVRNFQKAAQLVCRNNHGQVPDSFEDLMQLPGIGKYTAGAIMSIAFQKDYPVVDGNVERVFSRLFTIEDPIKSSQGQKQVWSLAATLLPKKMSRQWNQALMELGALVCKKGRPECQLCPLARHCQACQAGTTALHPVAGKRTKTIPISFVAAIIVHADKIYIQKRLPNVIWGNLWEFPGGHLETDETPEQGTVREVNEETAFEIITKRSLPIVQHSYTKYKATLHAYLCDLNSGSIPQLNAAQEYKWLSLTELDKLTFSAGHRKLIEQLKADPKLLQARISG